MDEPPFSPRDRESPDFVSRKEALETRWGFVLQPSTANASSNARVAPFCRG
jgi:hypothetical protein